MDTDPRLIRGFQLTAGLVALLMFVQAALAGQFIAQDEPDLKDVHRFVGYFLFLGTALQVALAWLTRDVWRYRIVVWAAVILLVTVVQTALGDVNRSEHNADLVAIHIPLGVLLFSLSSIVAMLSVMDEGAKTALRERA